MHNDMEFWACSTPLLRCTSGDVCLVESLYSSTTQTGLKENIMLKPTSLFNGPKEPIAIRLKFPSETVKPILDENLCRHLLRQHCMLCPDSLNNVLCTFRTTLSTSPLCDFFQLINIQQWVHFSILHPLLPICPVIVNSFYTEI